MDVDIPEVLAEVTTQFERYEMALMADDVAVLDELFHKDARTLRYGIAENLYGHSEIVVSLGTLAGRADAQDGMHDHHVLWPGLRGRLDAVLSRHAAGQGGAADADLGALSRGWRIVAAHVSVIDEPAINIFTPHATAGSRNTPYRQRTTLLLPCVISRAAR